jgi:hypothetical protein
MTPTISSARPDEGTLKRVEDALQAPHDLKDREKIQVDLSYSWCECTLCLYTAFTNTGSLASNGVEDPAVGTDRGGHAHG